MKIYLLIKPWDYTTAEVDVYRTKEYAEQALKDGEGQNAYWKIEEVTLRTD